MPHERRLDQADLWELQLQDFGSHVACGRRWELYFHGRIHAEPERESDRPYFLDANFVPVHKRAEGADAESHESHYKARAAICGSVRSWFWRTDWSFIQAVSATLLLVNATAGYQQCPAKQCQKDIPTVPPACGQKNRAAGLRGSRQVPVPNAWSHEAYNLLHAKHKLVCRGCRHPKLFAVELGEILFIWNNAANQPLAV